MAEAAPIGDIFVTATGDISVIRKEHYAKNERRRHHVQQWTLQRRNQHPRLGITH